MADVKIHLQSLIRSVRRQIRRRTLLQGSAVTLVAFFAGAVALLLLVPVLGGTGIPFWLALCGVLAAILGIAFWQLVHPLRQPISDRQIALFIEEQAPGLEDRLNSAVEAKAQNLRGADAFLQDLLEDAARMTQAIVPSALVRKVRARLIAGTSAALVTALVILGGTNLDRIRLVTPTSGAAARAYMTIAPGNVEIEKGESQEIVATLRERTDKDVYLVYREGEEWIRTAMESGLEGTDFMKEFVSIQHPITYYVEVGERRSDPFEISVYEFPAVRQIDLAYEFPDHIPLPPRIEEDAGDIQGLEGSTVTVSVHVAGRPTSASMVLESGDEITLRAGSDGQFTGRLTLAEEDLYAIQLVDANGKQNQFPDQYAIIPVPDQTPHIQIQDPGRDMRANAVEEVLIAADVDDDFGVDAFDLVFFVGADDAQTVNLLQAPGLPTSSGEHLLFLEDYSLQPGDVITYYVEARDATQSTATDMYFIEVIPFDQTYTQVSASGGGQSGGQQSATVVSQQEIIAATWRLLREKDAHDDYDGARNTLAGAQGTLRRSIEERLNSTAFSMELRANELQQQTVRYLQEATAAMEEAEQLLRRDELRDALHPERKALTSLLRADAQNKENQVAQQQQQGQGGGMSATEERMSELMDLELDISKDKYEMQQERAAETQELDDALRQVKDLARRQQDLTNQPRPDELEEDDRRRFVDRLRRDQEEVRQQLEQVAREARQNDTEGRMDRALRNMREADRALGRGNLEEAMQRQQEALRELQQLQPDLQRAARGSLRSQLEALTNDLQEIADRERQLAEDLNELVEQGTRPTEEDMRPLDEERLALMDALHQSLEEAARMERQTEDPDLRTQLRNLQQQVLRDDLTGDMESSYRALRNGWLDSAQRLEEEILDDLAGLEDARRQLAASLPVTEEEALANALREVRELEEELQNLESNAERLRGGEPGGDQRSLEARVQRQLARAQERIEDLMERGGGAATQSALGGIQNALARADHTGVLLDEEAAKAFFERNVYDPLNQLEEAIARTLDIAQMEDRLYGSRRGEVPPEYSEMVEKYYETLSRQ